MRPGVLWKVSPRCSASSPEVGFHSTFVDVTTTGVSSGRAPRLGQERLRVGLVAILEVDPLVGLGRAHEEPAECQRLGREP